MARQERNAHIEENLASHDLREWEPELNEVSRTEIRFEFEQYDDDCDSVSIMSCLGAGTVSRLTENKILIK
jgi:hypothetical protein